MPMAVVPGTPHQVRCKQNTMNKMKQALLAWMALCLLLAEARPVVRSIRSAHGEKRNVDIDSEQ